MVLCILMISIGLLEVAQPALVEFQGAMWAVYFGTAYSSTDGLTWTQETAIGAAGGNREHASLTVLNNSLWLIGGDNGGTHPQ